MALRLVRLSPDRAVRVRALDGDTVLCSQARHLTLTVPLSAQVYKWVPVNLLLRVTLQWTSIPPKREQKYSWSLHATETRICSGLMGHLVRMQSLSTFTLDQLSSNGLQFPPNLTFQPKVCLQDFLDSSDVRAKRDNCVTEDEQRLLSRYFDN